MRVAVVANTAWYLHNFRSNLMQALRAAGHEVVAISPRDGRHDTLIASAGVGFESVSISGAGTHPLTELRSVLAMHRTLRRRGIDLVLSYTPKGNLYAALAAIALGIPFVPNVSGLGRAFIRRSLVTFVVRGLYRLTLGRAMRVFFQNEDDLAMFVGQGIAPMERCERLPGSGVDLARFVPAAVPARPADAPAFLLVARMLWDKGVGEFTEAARTVQARYPGAQFRLLGFVDVANPSAIPRTQIDAWVAEGLVVHLGATDDVRPFLKDADCVVLPSYREGVPRTLLEAAATARPVIATDAPGCRDTVVDRETGFLCRTRDANDLADKMLAFIALPPSAREAMGKRGRAFVETHFDERLVLQRYLEVVASLDVAPQRR